MAQTMAAVLKQSGDDLTRANVMKQAANIKDLQQGGLLPGIKINTSPTDFSPIEQLQLMRFKVSAGSCSGASLMVRPAANADAAIMRLALM